MGHQKLVRDYLALYTPYRGLLLYHGLGAGKTCSSIAIAEGLKSTKKVFVMVPASLRMNYIEELKKCGDPLYRKNQSSYRCKVSRPWLLLSRPA
jgi:SNF2 family DNA or RNA helicase